MQDGRSRSAVRQVERPGGPPQPAARRPAPRADVAPPRRRQLRRLPPGGPPGRGRDELRRLPPGAPPSPGRDLAPGGLGPAVRRAARRLVVWARALGKPPERYGPGRLLVREEPLLPPVVWITVALAVTVIASLFAGLVLSTRAGAGTPATSAVTVRGAGAQEPAADTGRNGTADGGAGAGTSEAAAAAPAGPQPSPGTPGDPGGAGSTGDPGGEAGDADGAGDGADPSADPSADDASNPASNPEPSPEPTPEVPPPPTLAVGSAGDDVARLQADLARLGLYGGPVTGSYDQATADSVRAFQGSVGGTGDPDGVFGPPTRGALQAVVLSRG